MSTWEDETSMAQYDGAIVRTYWCSDSIDQVGADNRRFRKYRRLSALRAEHRSRSTTFCPPGYDLSSSIRNEPTLLTKDMTGAHINFKWRRKGGKSVSPRTSLWTRASGYLTPLIFLIQKSVFNVAFKEENDTVELLAAPSLGVIKCSSERRTSREGLFRIGGFGRHVFLSQKSGFVSGRADRKLIESSR